MGNPFVPPGISSLSEVDVADVPYHDQFVVIDGLVSECGQAGWPGRNESYQVHCFTLAAWRRTGGKIVARDLVVLWPLPTDTEGWGRFEEYTTHRIEVLLSTDETRAVFVRQIPGESPDGGLLAIAEKLRTPVIISTERFGDLVLDRRLDRFAGDTEWNGDMVDVSFKTDDDGSIETFLPTAELLWTDQASWQSRIDARIVDDLFEAWRDGWREEGEADLTPEEFLARIRLTCISIERDGHFTFWYEDGDLFWGHAIEVRCNLKDGPTEVGIAG